MAKDMRCGIEPKNKRTNGNCEPSIITIEDILAASAKLEISGAVVIEKKSACPATEVCDGQMYPQKLGIMCQEETSGAEMIKSLFEPLLPEKGHTRCCSECEEGLCCDSRKKEPQFVGIDYTRD